MMLVSKTRYAQMKGRTQACVSNWIKEGKITSRALIGRGPRAQIWVEQADNDLMLHLDPSQQYAQATLGKPEANTRSIRYSNEHGGS